MGGTCDTNGRMMTSDVDTAGNLEALFHIWQRCFLDFRFFLLGLGTGFPSRQAGTTGTRYNGKTANRLPHFDSILLATLFWAWLEGTGFLYLMQRPDGHGLGAPRILANWMPASPLLCWQATPPSRRPLLTHTRTHARTHLSRTWEQTARKGSAGCCKRTVTGTVVAELRDPDGRARSAIVQDLRHSPPL